MADFNIKVKVDPSNAKRGSAQVSKSLGRVESNAKRLQQTLIRTFAAVGIAAGLGAGIQTLASFEQQMSTVKAITEATGAEFTQLENRAKTLGATTRFSATQAGEGMLFLARAGFDVNETLETVDDTLLLAQAGALDLGRAADIATNVLTGFRLETNQAARVVDVLALAANSANTDVGQLGDAMKFVAPVAAGLGVELETAAAAAGVLSNAGLQASLAGTGLRRVLSELESPSSKTTGLLKDMGLSADDVRVSQIGLVAALENLKKAGVDTGLALEIFGDRGGPAFEVLSSSIPDIIQMEEELKNAEGTAKRIADVMDDNLNGALLAVKSSIEAVVLSFGDIGGGAALTEGMRGLAQALRSVAGNLDDTLKVMTAFGVIIATIKFAPLIQSLGSAVAQYVALQIAVQNGTVVVLGSALADKQKAAAAVVAAEAELAKTAALITSTRAQSANALVVQASAGTELTAAVAVAEAQLAKTTATIAATRAQLNSAVVVKGATTNDFARSAILKQISILEAERVVALNALTAAQGRSTIATQASTQAEFIRSAQLKQVSVLEAQRAAQLNTLTAAQGRSSAATKASLPILGSLTKALNLVKSAAIKMFAVLVANPIALIIIAIAALIALWVVFADKIKLTTGEFATLEDFGTAAMNRLKEVIGVAADFWEEKFSSFGELFGIQIGFVNADLSEWLIFIAQTIDDAVGIMAAGLGLIVFGIKGLPRALGDLFFKAVNGIIGIVEDGVNKIIAGLNKIPKVDIDLVDFGELRNKFAGEGKALADSLFDGVRVTAAQTGMEDFVRDMIKDAQEIALDRELATPSTNADFIGPLTEEESFIGPRNQIEEQRKKGPGSKDFQSVLADLQTEADLLKLSSREHAFRAEMLDLTSGLEEDLTEKQVEQLEEQLKLNIALREQAELLDSIQGPQADLIARENALINLYRSGRISLEEYTEQMKLAKEATAELAGIEPTGFETFTEKLKDVPSTTDVLMDGFDALSGSITDFVATGEADFSRFAESILRQATQILLNRAILSLIGAFGGNIGGGAGLPAGPLQSSGQFQTGGSFVVGGSGGPDSQAVLLNATPGETVSVQTPGQVQDKQATAQEVNVTAITTFDPEIAVDAINTRAGGKVVMGHIERNAKTIKKILGG